MKLNKRQIDALYYAMNRTGDPPTVRTIQALRRRGLVYWGLFLTGEGWQAVQGIVRRRQSAGGPKVSQKEMEALRYVGGLACTRTPHRNTLQALQRRGWLHHVYELCAVDEVPKGTGQEWFLSDEGMRLLQRFRSDDFDDEDRCLRRYPPVAERTVGFIERDWKENDED